MSMSPRERLGYTAIGALLLFGFGFIGARRMRQPAPIVFDAHQTVSNAGSPSPGASRPAEPVVVHVAGAVKSPGVVRLRAGSRVVDAIHASGGPSARADLDSINLAAKLIDGSQLRVPSLLSRTLPKSKSSKGRPEPSIDTSGYFAPVRLEADYLPDTRVPRVAGTAPSEPQGRTVRSDSAKATVTEVNLNTATSEELQALPGVGLSTAQKILEYRNRNGAFRSADELLAVKGIGPKKLEKLKPYVKV